MNGVLVHEWIAESGGSENVLQALSELFPESEIVCLWNDSQGRFPPARIRESWIAHTPLRRNKAAALPFMMSTWRRRPSRDYEWALISSHLFAHHARFSREAPGFQRFVYVHTPARYIWAPELDGRGGGLIAKSISSLLKPIDRRAATRSLGTTTYASNSRFIMDRVRACWGVSSRVIYPPVDVTTIQSVVDWRTQLTERELDTLGRLPEDFLLGASRFVPYKRLDLVIAAGESSGRPVVLAGRGPDESNLRRTAEAASVPVHFVDFPSTPMLRALYQATAALVFPAIEDFGIMPVEAMASGSPVLANVVGGTAETVLPGRTGALSDFKDSSAVRQSVERATRVDREACRQHARTFSAERFASEIRSWITTA